MYNKAKALDPTRLLSIGSGWDDVPGNGDIRDIHDHTYRPGVTISKTTNRAVVLGEYGGFASAVAPHNWTGRSNKTGEPENILFGGYNPDVPRDANVKHDLFRPTFTIDEPFERQYERFVDHLHLLQNYGLQAAVYIQMTDMKLEENGWLTFDREVSKIDPDRLREIHQRLYTEPPKQNVIIFSSHNSSQIWKKAEMPFPLGEGIDKDDDPLDVTLLQKTPDFENMDWTKAEGPFGNTFKPVPVTPWAGQNQLFIHKSFELEEIPENLSARIYYTRTGEVRAAWMHARIYINGEFVGDEGIRQIMPESRMSEMILPAEEIKRLRKGENSVTVQFVPGLNSKSGMLEKVTEHILVDVALT